jgi:predicted secreted protein
MAAFTGVDAVVAFSSGIVTNITEWVVNENQEAIDVTSMTTSGAYREFIKSGWTEWNGSFTRYVDTAAGPTNTTGTTGSATFTTKTGQSLAGTIYVTGSVVNTPVAGVLTETVTFQGSGTLTKASA